MITSQTNVVSFFLNGQSIVLEDPSPQLLLIDFLRSPEVGLTGAKKGCGQGGCGACTVILSSWNETTQTVEHISINSCLRPVCSLGGLAVTTIEGTGGIERPENRHLAFTAPAARGNASVVSREGKDWVKERTRLDEKSSKRKKAASERLDEITKKGVKSGIAKVGGIVKETIAKVRHEDSHEGMNPVAHRLAINNGTQCGYCTTGFVMNMSAFLAANPSATKKEIESAFDGNICRCTGYRAILTGMKTFASDWTQEDEENRMKCLTEDKCAELLVHDNVYIPFPDGAKAGATPTNIEEDGKYCWVTPQTLDELLEVLQNNPVDTTRMVFGNTSYGVYADEFPQVELMVDIKLIKEFHGINQSEDGISIGAGTTYSELLNFWNELNQKEPFLPTSRQGGLQYMTHRTAGMIVRNAGSLGGNTMMVLRHYLHGEPFPSDLLTMLDAVDTVITFIHIRTGEQSQLTVSRLVARLREDPRLAEHMILVNYFIPKGDAEEFVLAQKVALRQVNSHTIVNSGSRLEISGDLIITKATLIFGGIAPVPWHASKTEKMMTGQTLSLDLLVYLIPSLQEETEEELTYWDNEGRYDGLPSEGFTNAYKIQLATAYLYKLVVRAMEQFDAEGVPSGIASAGEINWGNWPASKGSQSYVIQDYKKPLSQPYIKLMAMYQAMGEVHYTHELPIPETGKNAAFVQSQRTLATYHFINPDNQEEINIGGLSEILGEKYPGFYCLINHENIPIGGLNKQGMGMDQPLFTKQEILYYGQVIAMAIADTEQEAIEIAEYVSTECLGYAPIDWPTDWQKPIMSIADAITQGSIFPDAPESAPFVTHIWKITRPDSEFYWTEEKDPLDTTPSERETNIDGAVCKVIGNTQISGEQVHFYMETQSCVAIPEDGDQIKVHPSSQSPMEMHQTVAMSLASEHNKVNVDVRQLGGGYGGKTEQAKFVTGSVAVAAHALNLPVRLAMKREHDTAMIGKRHGLYGQYQIAVDTGNLRDEDKGLIRGFYLKTWADGGAFYDCSYIVTNCIQLRIDNAYRIKNFQNQIDVCRTNKAPSTAMRAFGDIQGKLVLENAVDDAAYTIGMDPVKLRLKNMYQRGDVTPFGQALSYCYMRDVWAYVQEKSQYVVRSEQVKEFNRKNKWKKRGIYMIPVKYGSGYNLVMLEQAAAIVTIYSGDGSVSINQGGVDMGQGVMTALEQLAAYVLNIPMDMIIVHKPSTKVIPNPSSTGGSTGTAYNGEAVKQTCEKMRARMTEFGYQLLNDKGEGWCKAQGVDFWNYGKEGWAAKVTKEGDQHSNLIWQNLVALAYQFRVDLVASFTAPIRGGETPVPTMTFKPASEQKDIPGIKFSGVTDISGAVDSFVGFTFSAACAEVEIDVLTGETKVLQADIVYDMGWSLNPAIDIGQVEGAFVQGIGYVMTEKLTFQPGEGDDEGRLNTLNTWRYKPPAVTTIPLEMNTYLYPRNNSSEVPENANELFSAKEVGEPPLVLAASVFFAIKSAIRDSRVERGLDGIFKFDAPATVQEVSQALAVDNEDYTNQ